MWAAADTADARTHALATEHARWLRTEKLRVFANFVRVQQRSQVESLKLLSSTPNEANEALFDLDRVAHELYLLGDSSSLRAHEVRDLTFELQGCAAKHDEQSF